MKNCFLILGLLMSVTLSPAESPQSPLRAVRDPGVITTRQSITPAGVPAIVKGRVYAVSFGSNPDEFVISTDGAFYRFDWKKNELLAHEDWKGTPGMQSLRYDLTGRQGLTVIAANGKAGAAPSLELVALHD